ncbi:hypothetical protein [Sulfurimonas sp. HSL3-7]|uniref:hypothetical protein n=1 Tax=Sulfonitrofixus jiaomeiensis TaxID=3131938 RepID=UPI0031F73F6F
MVKERYVRNMQQARTSNVRQLHSLKLLGSGLDIDKSHFIPELTETVLGRWFYGEALLFSSDGCRDSLRDIEETMTEFHAHFGEIYAAYYGRRAGGLLGLIGLKREIPQAQTAKIRRHYDEMVLLCDRLRRQMNRLENIMAELPDETFFRLSRMPKKSLRSA